MYADSIENWRTAEEVNTAMAGVYKNMGVAILVSMGVSYFVGSNPVLLGFFFSEWIKWITIFAPIALALTIGVIIHKVSKSVAYMLLLLFATLMGLSFSTIFAVYKIGSVVSAFMGGAVIFTTMSFWGYFTKRDLTTVGQFLIVGAIGLLILGIINIFIGSSLLSTIFSAVALIVFTGLTAYDTQKIREMVSTYDPNGTKEVAGALTLYIDFINIFLSLLNLFGDKKE